jgi:hypothetical protein
MRSIPVLPVPAGLDCPGQPDKTFGILFEPANEREKGGRQYSTTTLFPAGAGSPEHENSVILLPMTGKISTVRVGKSMNKEYFRHTRYDPAIYARASGLNGGVRIA